jgi:hypothetical protein
LGQGLDDVPALLFGGGDEGADDGEVTRTLFGAEAAGDFLPDLHHAAVAFGLVVGEGDGGIGQEAQHIALARHQAQQQVVAGPTRWASPSAFAALGRRGCQRGLSLMEGQTLGDDGVVASSDQIDQGGLQRRVPVTGQMSGMAGAPQQALHPARPVLLVDLDLEFAQVVGVAQGMPHALQGVVGLPGIVDDDAGDAVEQAAAPGRDTVEDEP